MFSFIKNLSTTFLLIFLKIALSANAFDDEKYRITLTVDDDAAQGNESIKQMRSTLDDYEQPIQVSSGILRLEEPQIDKQKLDKAFARRPGAVGDYAIRFNASRYSETERNTGSNYGRNASAFSGNTQYNNLDPALSETVISSATTNLRNGQLVGILHAKTTNATNRYHANGFEAATVNGNVDFGNTEGRLQGRPIERVSYGR